MKYSLIRDADGNLTEYTNGERFTYADPVHTVNNPLPRFALIGHFVAKIIHRSQKTEGQTCTKCLSDDHPTWKCGTDNYCIVCKQQGHTAGSDLCQHFVDNNYAYTFGGRRYPLHLSKFSFCKFTYNDYEYESR